MNVPLIPACAAASGTCTPESFSNTASEDEPE